MIGFTRVAILKKGLIFEKMTHSKPVWQLHLKATSINQLSPKSHKLFLQTQSKQAFIVVTFYKVIILRVEHFTRIFFRLMATNGRHLTCLNEHGKVGPRKGQPEHVSWSREQPKFLFLVPIFSIRFDVWDNSNWLLNKF